MRSLPEDILPNVVYVAEDAADDELTKRVISRLRNQSPSLSVVQLDGVQDPLSALARSQEPFTVGKQQLVLRRHHGEWMRACPGTSQHVCCNLWTVDPGEGCPMDCTYCYLQSYLRRNPTNKIFTNIESLLQEITERTSQAPNRLFRICTGEVIDSLVWDSVTDLTRDLVPFFARIPNALLELKTKSASVENLLDLRSEHHGKTVVSWSVNANSVCQNDEAKTASLSERLNAAAQLAQAGYRIGFHFDPVIHFDGWEEEYSQTIERVFEAVSPQSIAWISLSTLRYKPEMHDMMKLRFPFSKLPYGEQFLAKDGKLRYIQPLRMKMLSSLWRKLKQVSSSLPVYMCMESAASWHQVAGGPPVAGQELIEVFSRRGNLPVMNSSLGNE